MKNVIISICFFILGFQNTAQCQLSEIKEFQEKKTKSYLSNGQGKSKGLKFSIQYPVSYSPYEIDNYGMVKGFSKNSGGSSIMIGLLKHEEALSLEAKKHLLAQANLEKSMRSISSTAQVIKYKGGFEVGGYMAASLDFQVNDAASGNLIIRTCNIEINNYSVILSFLIPLSNKLTPAQASAKLNTYIPFFDFVLKSFKTTDQKKQTDELKINTQEYLKYKEQIPETDKSKGNDKWINELYRNTKYKFRVNFPKAWEYDAGASKKTLARAMNREKAATMAISVTHLEQIKSKDSSNIFKGPPMTRTQMNDILAIQNMKIENFKSEKAYLNNFPAYMYEFTSEAKAGTDSYTYLSKQIQCMCQNKLYTLVINLPLENWDEEMMILFDRFIKSFVFEIAF